MQVVFFIYKNIYKYIYYIYKQHELLNKRYRRKNLHVKIDSFFL